MTSKSRVLQSYVKEVPAERRVAIEKLRGLCQHNLAGYKECMEYGMQRRTAESTAVPC